MTDGILAPSTARLDVLDKLSHTASIVQFVQSITLLGNRGSDLHLQPGQVLGLYNVLQNIHDGLEQVQALVDAHEFAQKEGVDHE